MKELQLQRLVMDYLQYREKNPNYKEHWRRSNVQGVPTHRRKSDGSMIYRKSAQAGVPDIEGLIDGFYCGIELKKKGGKLTQNQVEYHSRLKKANGFVFVCSSLEEVEISLKCVYEQLSKRTESKMGND